LSPSADPQTISLISLSLTIPVQITRVGPPAPDIPLPSYATEGSAGVDLRAAIPEELLLKPGERWLVPTGIAIALPMGYEAQVRPRSGLAAEHGIGILNAPGTIDSDYRGEIKVILMNYSQESFLIRRGERIAQLVVAPYVRMGWTETESLDETSRGSGGFGHTGR
jgi:dUTP diphosphatase